jgi:hypothetical protein
MTVYCLIGIFSDAEKNIHRVIESAWRLLSFGPLAFDDEDGIRGGEGV